MCLSLDYKTEERLMIDGLQRISSIIKFLTDDSWRLSNLDDVDVRISGRTPEHIRTKYSDIYTRIENITIPVTVLRCDYSKRTHMHYLFTIFHRLNTGGNKLSNQEIRNCIFQSEFNNILKRIVQTKVTKSLFSLKGSQSYRFAYEEIFLRAFTFSYKMEGYSGKLAKYINDFMEDQKKSSDQKLEEMECKMTRTVSLIYNRILDGKALPRLSKATTEALLVGVYTNIDLLENENDKSLIGKFEKLREHENFSIISLKEGLSATEKVKGRINTATAIFSS